MKKIISVIVFTIVNVLISFAQNSSCDRLFTSQITYNDDFLDLHYNNTTVGNYYKIFHRTNESVNTSLNIIDVKKPIIIIEGYDIFHTESCQEIYDHYINYDDFGDDLRAEGYDIITFNLSAPMASIQPNALLFANFIEFINNNKVGDGELIILGVSMGGLITRYALTYMEENNMQHQTKLFISFDSPQKGGYAPLSMQALLTDPNIQLAAILAAGAANSPELAYLINCFVSDGSRQMLTHHVARIENGYASPLTHHDLFFNELNNLNSCGGFPINCKSIAISNGSINGETQDGLNIFGDYSGNPAVSFAVGSGFFTAYRGLYTAPGVDNWTLESGVCVYERASQECNSSQLYYMEKDGQPLDHAPGGYYPWYNELVEQLQSINSITILLQYNENSCFVSTNSALGLNTDDLLLDIGSYSKSQILQDTYFDDIWWDYAHSNMYHTSYNGNIKTFVEEQIELSEIENYAEEFVFVSGGMTNSGVNNLSKASNLVEYENYTVLNGGQLSLKSGNEISLKPGFTVEEGAVFTASIENIQSKDCNLAGNLPQFSPTSYCFNNRSRVYATDTTYGDYVYSLYLPINQDIEKEIPISNTKMFELFPNPTQGIINIIPLDISTTSYSVSVLDVYGNIVLQELFSRQSKVDLSKMSSGIYFIIIDSNGEEYSTKIVLY